MHRLIYAFIPFLLTGCLRGCGAPAAVPDADRQVPIVEEEEVKRGEASASSSASSEQAVEAPVAIVAEEIPTASFSSSAKREPEFIPQALSWALGTRDLLAKIGKLLAIEEGRYELKEGESRPDLHGMYAALSVSLKTIDASHDDAVLRGLMHEIDQELTMIVGGFSNPPTIEELREAQESKGAMNPKIDALYKYLDELRKREAAMAE